MTTELTGRHILIILVAFFGIILAVNIDLVIKAETTFSGEDEHNPYLQGLDFNDTLARRAEQARLGWQAGIIATRGAGNAITVQVDVQQKDGTPPPGLTLEGLLRHPSDAERDQALTFQSSGNGRFLATLPNVPNGVWNIEVHSTSQDPFEADKRIWLH